MVRRIFILLLVFSVLGYGVMASADVHAFTVADHEHVDHDEHSHDDPNVSDNCDHCCHAGMHNIGISLEQSADLFTNTHVMRSSYLTALINFSPQKHLRPPITI